MLQLYPYPALVLVHDLESTNGTSPTPIPGLERLSPLWTNAAWKRFAGTRTLTDTLSPQSLLRLDNWLSQRTTPESPSRDGELKLRAGEAPDEHLCGVVNRRLDEHLQRHASEGDDESGSDGDDSRSSRSPPLESGPALPDDTPLVIDSALGVPMSLAKTVFPVTVSAALQLRETLPNLALIVVTTMPAPLGSITTSCECYTAHAASGGGAHSTSRDAADLSSTYTIAARSVPRRSASRLCCVLRG